MRRRPNRKGTFYYAKAASNLAIMNRNAAKDSEGPLSEHFLTKAEYWRRVAVYHLHYGSTATRRAIKAETFF